MAERLVLCGEAFSGQPSHQEALRLNLSGAQPNITLRLEDISPALISRSAAAET
jgi:hypothetical protein